MTSVPVTFKSSDGLILRGNLFESATADAPTLVMAGGFSLLKEANAGFASRAQALGISAFIYDHRSFGASEGTPRQEIDLYQQAKDFSDAVSAVRALPDVDNRRVVAWGAGHGAGIAMMAATVDPRIAALALLVPFASGEFDASRFPAGLLERAWRHREESTRNPGIPTAYAKVWRDWENDGDGDEASVFLGGKAGYLFQQGTKADAVAVGSQWENQVTLQSFINVAGTHARDFAPRVRVPTIYVVPEGNPLTPPVALQRSIFETMGGRAEFKSIPPGEVFQQLAAGQEAILEWVARTV